MCKFNIIYYTNEISEMKQYGKNLSKIIWSNFFEEGS